jgi:hypothetical protein
MSETQYHVAAGPDTFMVNYKFVNEEGHLTGESLPDHIADQLDAWQKAARKEHKPVPTDLTFSYDVREGERVNQSLFIYPHGSAPWPWMLFSDDIKVYFAPGTLNKGLFCQVRFSSHLLWMVGPETAIVQVESLLAQYLGRPDFFEQTSEIHLCVDVVGFDFSRLCLAGGQLPFVSRVTRIKDRPTPPVEEEQECGLTPEEIKDLKDKIDQEEERFCQASLTTTHRRVSTIDFGSHASPISCQIYNKSLEIRQHKKEWFEPIWISYGWDGKSTVWRIEFRFKRAFLRTFQMSEAFSTLACIPALWKYATCEWLRFIDPDQVTTVNVSRLPTHPVWEVVQQAYDNVDTLAPRDPEGEKALRLELLLEEKPAQVLRQAVLFSHTEEEFRALAETLEEASQEVVRGCAHDAFSGLTPDQQAQILDVLSTEPLYQVQATLVKRRRRMARLKGCIAAGIGYIRTAVAMADPAEFSSLTPIGPGVSASKYYPDRVSSALWFARRALAYDQEKGRSHTGEIMKKQVIHGFLTAMALDEERRLFGVQLEPEDVAAIDEAIVHFSKGSEE